MLQIGLNPYGLTLHPGTSGAGHSARANPKRSRTWGLCRDRRRASRQNARNLRAVACEMSDAELAALRGRLAKLGMQPVVSSGLQYGRYRELSAVGKGPWRHDHPPRADADPLRRPECRWGEMD